MNIYERLIKDHDKQRDIMNKLGKTTGDSLERRTLFEALKLEAESHANAEEQVFYAALIEDPETQEQTRHSIAEHKETSDLVQELEEKDMSSSGWIQTFEKLKHDLEHHIDEEEKDVFKVAKDIISDEDALKMAKEFEDNKAAEQKDMCGKSGVKHVA